MSEDSMNNECERFKVGEMTIEDKLRDKLKKEKCEFEQNEIKWLVKNIGHPNPEVRDQLVYRLLSNGILNGHFTVEEYGWVKSYLLEKELYFYELPKIGVETLPRSFSVLICACCLIVDTDEQSIYYHSL